jgi:hypothetical protein
MVTAFLYLILHAPSDIRGTSKLVRMPSPWHLGMRRLTAHRPLGVEAPCRGLPSDVESRWRPARVRALRLVSRGCCPPVGRGSGGCAWYWLGHHLNTPRARPQAEHTTSWPSAVIESRVLQARPPHSIRKGPRKSFSNDSHVIFSLKKSPERLKSPNIRSFGSELHPSLNRAKH